jgi:hypothetical protein
MSEIKGRDLDARRTRMKSAPCVSVGEALKKAGITASIIAGGHGTTVRQADIAAALGTEMSRR